MAGNARVMLILCAFLALQSFAAVEAVESHGPWQDRALKSSSLVFRDFKEITRTEAGEIKSVQVRIRGEEEGFENLGHMELSFMTLDPQSMLLPMFLSGDFIFYVHTGEARLGWAMNNRLVEKDLSVGDIYRIPVGSVFHVFNTGKAERLRLIGILDRTSKRRTGHIMEQDQSQMFFFGGDYSVVSGFDEDILQTAFKVSKEELRELLSGQNSGPIVRVTEKHRISSAREMRKSYMLRTKNALQGILGWKTKSRREPFNILKKKPSFSNKHGWTVAVDRKDYPPLKYSDIGVFMVNLSKDSMLIPHWNPRASEIGVVTQGVGILQVVYPNGSHVESFRVSKGDVFMVPRFYPMVQLALGNESFEVLGFSTYGGDNHPQFIAGVNSVFNVLDLESVALGFGVSGDYLADFLATQKGAVIVSCHSCAQEVEEKIQREEKRGKEE